MRTIKSGLWGLILLVVVASALFLTCDVGLGNSVDTKPPTVTITYPPVQSIIKNSFTMAGAASDDTSLASVTVGVVNTVTAATYGPYAATIDATKGSWSLVVNNHTGSGFEIRDGTYEMTVTAVDGAGRKSVATTTYEIDNTPPVVVIERPGTNGPLASVAPEVYGTELKITGSINDDHAIDKLVLTAYDTAGNVVGSPITQTNISGVAMDITLAKSYKAPATSEEVALNAVYNSLYNKPDANGTQNYYCTITASDSAREYNPPAAVASADNTRGNINSVYYVYDNIYSSIFAATGYGVTMKDLTAMFNGSYADTAKSTAVLNALAAKARPAASWSTASATFSLNPMNSPTFTVQGYDPLTNGSDITLAKNQKANSTDLTVIAHTGRDAVPLNKDALKVVLVPCNASAVETGSGTTLLPSLAECGGDAAAIAARDKQITKSGTDYLIQVTVKGDANSYYRIEVTGADQSGNAIDNYGKIYGFMVVTNGLPPTIVVLTPTLNSYAAATVASHSVTFSGTIDSENGTPELMLAGYTETNVKGTRFTTVDNAAFDKNNSATYVLIPLTPSGTTNRWNWSYTIDTTHNLSDANAKTVSATAVGNGEDLYTYTMVLYAINKTNSPAQVTHVFFVDSAPPTAELVSVTPTTGSSPYVVNGIVSAVLRFADDDRITAATYQLGGDPIQTIPTLNGYTITDIDTRKYDDDATGLGKLPLEIKLTDRAGLTSTYRTDVDAATAWLVKIDQTLDKPKLTVNYANTSVTAEAGINATTNLYGRDGYTAINGTVSDDDGIDSVLVHVKGGAVDKDFNATVTGSTYSYDLSGLTPGYYDIMVTAMDNALHVTTSTPTFKIAYDDDVPDIQFDKDNPDNQFQKGDLLLKGTALDHSGLKSFAYTKGSETVAITPDAATNAWQVKIDKPKASEANTLTFTAEDIYGRKTTKTFTYKYDLDPPTITVTTPPANYFNQNYALMIKGTAAEAVSANPQSGLSEIQYAFEPSTDPLPAPSDWKTATGSADWVANVDLTDSGKYPDGAYTVFIRSVDIMGNASALVSYNVTGDRVAPTLNETQINTTNTVYKPEEFYLGGAISDTGSGIASFSYTKNGEASVDAMDLITSGTTWTLHETGVHDGTYSYVFTAKDKAGIISTVTRTVTIDKTNPTCSITSPAADAEGAYIKADSFNFKGEASDPGTGCSGLGTIKLTINHVDTSISPISTWSSVQDLTGLTEGTVYTAHLEVKDNAGNGGTADRNFKVDRAEPRATIVPGATAKGFTDSSVFYREAAFSLSGTCDDAAITSGRKATSVVLSCSKDGAPATKIASTVSDDHVPFVDDVIAKQEWTYSQKVNALTHENDGLYVYTLVVTDDAGRSTTATATVRIDTTAPTVVVTAPVANEAIASADAKYTFQGTASDLGSGIDTATLSGMLDGTTAVPLSLSGASWTAVGVPLGAEGTKTFKVNCKDKLGNEITPITVNFYYDLNKPELEETKIKSSTLITKNDFDIGGTCKDTNQMHTVDISATRAGVTTPKTWTWTQLSRIKNNTLEDWAWTIERAKLDYEGTSDGTYTFTIVATDVAGKTTTVQRTVIVDTQSPDITGVTDLTYAKVGWLRTTTQKVTGTVTDHAGGSGIDTVQYAVVTDDKLDDEPWYSMTVSGNTFTGSVSFSEGTTNKLYIRATDRAGNTKDFDQGPIYVDATAPTLSVDSPIGVSTVNGKNDLPIKVSVNDATSPLGNVSASLTTDADPYNAPDTWSEIASASPSGGTPTVTIPAASLNSLAEGSGKVYLRVKDAAGNYSTVATVNLLVDKIAPTGEVTSHVDSATVNKTIKISGTSNDANGVASVTSLAVWKGGAGTSDPDPTATTGWEAAASGAVSGTYNWSVDGFNTIPYGTDYDARSNIDGVQLCVRVAVTDTAGNVGYIMRKLTVDQDSDKPIVKLTNLATEGSPTLVQTKVIYGTITDDDGLVKSLRMKNSSSPSETWTDVPLDGQSFSYTVTGFDGAKQLYFEIVDKNDTMFTTDTVSSATTPRLYQADKKYLETPLSFNLDTTPPDIGSDSIGIKVSGNAVYSAYSSTNAYYGGSASGLFNVQFMASSANTVASATVTITDSASKTMTVDAKLGALVPVTADVSHGTLTTTGDNGLTAGTRVFFTGTTLPGGLTANVPYYVISDGFSSTAFKVSVTPGGSAIEISSTGSAVNFTTGWTTSSPIDITSLANGSASLSILTKDAPGLSSTMTKTILIDNLKPNISVTSHKMNDQVTGDVVFTGTSEDGSGSGVTAVKYHVGKCADLNAASWTPLDTQLSWVIDFTSAAGKVITTEATYAKEPYATETATDPESHIWILPIYLRAIDKAGNVSDYTFYLNVDPDGDKPVATISYPASGTTLGGNIRIFGSAKDNVSVASVWMEIDTNNDGTYDATDAAALATVMKDGKHVYGADAAALANGFQIDGTASWSKTINSQKEFNAPGTVVSAKTITSGIRYKIETLGDTDYTKLGAESPKIGTEFTANANGTSSTGSGTVSALTNLIQFRVRAFDNNGTDGPWSGFNTIKIDNKAPTIGSSIPLKLVQYTDGTFKTVSAEKDYVSDMYIRGEWYLVGSVDDESGIKEIQVSGSQEGSLSGHSPWFVEGAAIEGSSYHDYTLRIPVGKATTDTSCGAQSYTVYVQDASDPTGTTTQTITLNYDNKAPVPADLMHGGIIISKDNLVVQSNNTYTFSSTITEDNKSDSGFDRLVFFFMRQTADKKNKRVYNPMLPIDGSYDSTNVKGNRTDLSNLTWVDGDVPQLALAGATRSSEDSLTHDSIVGNDNVRVGGLVRIAGVDRLIKTVNLTEGTITFSPSVSKDYTDASLLYGLVVDNTVVEVGVWSGSTLTSITNDDKDGMVESVVKSGGTWKWDASVNSKNIPDGPISLYYVAYDKAGNSVSGHVDSSVANSGPRIAKIQVGTDLTGDGNFDTSEVKTVYAATSGSEPTRVDLTDKDFKMKGDLAVIPEFVGGNGTLQYVWTANAAGTTAWDGTTYRATKATTSEGPLTPIPGVTVSGTANKDGIRLSAADTGISDMSGALKLFSFTVWDSTEETTSGTDSQWALINVPVNVAVKDITPPNAVIDEFYWASLQSNSVYGTSATTMDPSTLSGHIELPNDFKDLKDLNGIKRFKDTSGEYDLDPKVSGKITITGSAFDDQRLDSLWVTFDGFTPSEGYITSRTDSRDGKTYYKMASFNTSTGAWDYAATAPTMATDSYTFTVTPDYLKQEGHRVTWKLCIDTAKITNSVALDACVRVVADDRSPLRSLIGMTSSPLNVPYYRMDVVPYIKGIKTSLSTLKPTNSSVYDRTALGYYPVKSDQNAYFYGFNLVPGATVTDSAANTKTLGSADDTTFSGYTVYPAAISTFKSGDVSVTMDTVAPVVHVVSLNNVNSNAGKGTYTGTTDSVTGDYAVYSNYYNRQPNNDGNNLLTDDVCLDIWEMKIGAIPLRGALTDPVMRINPKNNIIGFAFINGPANFSMSSGIGFGATPTPNSYQTWQYNYADFSNVSFIYDSLGNAHGTVVGLDTEPTQTPAFGGDFTYVTSKWGTGNLTDKQDNYNITNKLRMESIGVPAGKFVKGNLVLSYGADSHGLLDTHRFRSPSIAVATHGSDTAAYLAYYDDIQEQIRFRYVSAVPSTRSGLDQFVDSNGSAGGVNQSIFEPDSSTFSVLAGKDNVLSPVPTTNLGVNFANASSTITSASAHGLSVGTAIYFMSAAGTPVLPTGITDDTTPYYVVSVPTTTTFTVSATLGGSPITFSNTSGATLGSTVRINQPTVPTLDTGNKAGEYLAIDVVPGTAIADDVVVAVWYNGTDLMYSYKTNPCTDNNAGTGTGTGYWSTAQKIFSNAGEYCAIKVDKQKGIHIAAYDTNGANLRYAYLTGFNSAYNEKNNSCVVDSYAITGTRITIDTVNATVNSKTVAIPYISYYMPTTQKTKMAYLVKPQEGDINYKLNGAANDAFTGNWEVTLIPTTNRVQDDRVNIGLWKLGDGYSTTNGLSGGTIGTWTTPGTATGTCYGNGTQYPVVGYAIKNGTAGAIEIAQKK